MVQGIEHTAIASPNPRRLADWYVEHLGFVVNATMAEGKIVFIKTPNGTMIEIIESNGAPPPAPNMKDPGLRHMALQVGDFDGAYEALKAKGVPFLAEKATVSGNTTAFFRDLDGNILHLLHREKPLP